MAAAAGGLRPGAEKAAAAVGSKLKKFQARKIQYRFPARMFPLPEKSDYARRMQSLSDKIFGDPPSTYRNKTKNVSRIMSQMPVEENRWRVDYFPPHPMFHYLTRMLRLHGLYRDEHMDWVEEMRRRRIARGIVRPGPSEGKRFKIKK